MHRPVEHSGYLKPGELSRHISKATCVQQLDEYVSEHRDVMNETHVSAALGSLVKLSDGRKALGLTDFLLQMLVEPQLGAGNVARIDLMSPRNLSAAFWALAKGGRADSAGFLRLKMRLCDRRVLADCNAYDLTNVLWSCAASDSTDTTFVEQLCKAVLELGISQFNTRELSNILWACATLKHVDMALIEAVCQEAWRRNFWGADPRHLAITAWVLATLAGSSPEVSSRLPRWTTVQGMLHMLVRNAAARLPDRGWQPLDLSQLVWALGCLDVYDAAFLDGIAKKVMASGMAGSKPQEWNNLLGGFATLRHSSPALFSAAVSLMRPLLPHFDARYLATTMLTYAIAAPPNSLADLLASAAELFVELMPSSSSQTVCNAACALAVSSGDGPRHTHAIARLARAVVDEAEGRSVDEFNHVNLRQLFQLYSELSANSRGSNPAHIQAPGLLQSRATAAWQSGTTTSMPSASARDIHALMQSMGWDATLEQRSPCNNFSADIEVAVGGVRVAWEVDGPSHFMRNDLDMRVGATRLRDRGMQRSYGRPSVIMNLVKEGWGPHLSVEDQRRILLHRRPAL